MTKELLIITIAGIALSVTAATFCMQRIVYPRFARASQWRPGLGTIAEEQANGPRVVGGQYSGVYNEASGVLCIQPDHHEAMFSQSDCHEGLEQIRHTLMRIQFASRPINMKGRVLIAVSQ
ncbi:MAG: hypothetical protein NTX86_04125 [Candidatus Dependentiae bacterium]|nr:hypothetical protein [Candidatus Dependentiae bacterium]